jgi:predicted PhzF superfamily epimerase YddE/YHI9
MKQMELSLYQIDAFASKLFEGNPAAVCPLDEWLPDKTMQCLPWNYNYHWYASFENQTEYPAE